LPRELTKEAMKSRASSSLPVTPPPALIEALRKRLSERELQALQAVFALRATAQQADNAITEWMAGTAGSPARFQILMRLWAASGRGVPHKDIVAALGVTRATVSGLMAGLERDGLVRSVVGKDDRRNQLVTLTSKGEAIVEKATEANRGRLRAAFAALPPDDVVTFMTLLQRVRQGFAALVESTPGRG
jgi:DNA-binding MarR family transcriptional regulator